MPPPDELRVLVVGLDAALSEGVTKLLRRESAVVEELAGDASPASLEPAQVVVASHDVAGVWLHAWPDASSRLVVFAPDADHDGVAEWLGAGADDVVTDAGRPQEIAARVRSVARRAGPARVRDMSAGGAPTDLVIDAERHEVRVRDVAIVLSARQFELLELLVANRGRVLTHQLLIERLWGSDDAHRFLNALQVQVKRLRDAIEVDPAAPRMIQTVRGVGYRFDHGPAPRGS